MRCATEIRSTDDLTPAVGSVDPIGALSDLPPAETPS